MAEDMDSTEPMALMGIMDTATGIMDAAEGMDSTSTTDSMGRHRFHHRFHGHNGFHRRFGLGATFISEPYRRYYPYYAPLPIYAQPQYWHYCTEPQGYYPYVTNCRGTWLPVVPQCPAP